MHTLRTSEASVERRDLEAAWCQLVYEKILSRELGGFSFMESKRHAFPVECFCLPWRYTWDPSYFSGSPTKLHKTSSTGVHVYTLTPSNNFTYLSLTSKSWAAHELPWDIQPGLSQLMFPRPLLQITDEEMGVLRSSQDLPTATPSGRDRAGM